MILHFLISEVTRKQGSDKMRDSDEGLMKHWFDASSSIMKLSPPSLPLSFRFNFSPHLLPHVYSFSSSPSHLVLPSLTILSSSVIHLSFLCISSHRHCLFIQEVWGQPPCYNPFHLKCPWGKHSALRRWKIYFKMQYFFFYPKCICNDFVKLRIRPILEHQGGLDIFAVCWK